MPPPSASLAEPLPPEVELALAHTPAGRRAALRIVFELDQRLGRIVAGTSEPMLGQMRLAWWREMLGKPAAERPRGDAVLDAIGEYWREGARGLVPLVDGWEHILGGDRLGEAAIDAFAEGRAAALLDPFGGTAGLADKTMQSARSAAEQWALADLASNVSDADERAIVIRRGLAKRVPAKRLPRELRGLAVLGALARRALERGGRPLLGGRGAALIAARAALFGR